MVRGDLPQGGEEEGLHQDSERFIESEGQTGPRPARVRRGGGGQPSIDQPPESDFAAWRIICHHAGADYNGQENRSIHCAIFK